MYTIMNASSSIISCSGMINERTVSMHNFMFIFPTEEMNNSCTPPELMASESATFISPLPTFDIPNSQVNTIKNSVIVAICVMGLFIIFSTVVVAGIIIYIRCKKSKKQWLSELPEARSAIFLKCFLL